MINVKEFVTSDNHDDACLIIGGDSAKINSWPVNPEGEFLLLVATIKSRLFKKITKFDSIPNEGDVYVFSTYSESEYFLENITYSGDEAEFNSIINAYTCVLVQNSESLEKSPTKTIPVKYLTLKEKMVDDDSYPVFSMVSASVPKGVSISSNLLKEYQFVMQIYSSDFPEPYEDIFYLTDAVGCLMLKKDGSGEGFFFVQSA